MTCYVFPGQGSQKVGMGIDLFEQFPNETQKASELLTYDIKELCLNDPNNRINNTQYTQPALFFVSALATLALKEQNNFNATYLAGHSLGEYNALFAANAFNLETGLQLVKKRGELMAQASGGSMAAIVGVDRTTIETILADNKLTNIDIANFNEPTQTVISGPATDIEKAKPIFEAAGVRRYIPLAVSGAFHSRYMAEAKNAFETFLKTFTFEKPQLPVIANVTATPYSTAEEIPKLLSSQMTGSVQWVNSITYLLEKNVTEFTEIGPGKVLTGLINKIKLKTLVKNS